MFKMSGSIRTLPGLANLKLMIGVSLVNTAWLKVVTGSCNAEGLKEGDTGSLVNLLVEGTK